MRRSVSIAWLSALWSLACASSPDPTDASRETGGGGSSAASSYGGSTSPGNGGTETGGFGTGSSANTAGGGAAGAHGGMPGAGGLATGGYVSAGGAAAGAAGTAGSGGSAGSGGTAGSGGATGSGGSGAVPVHPIQYVFVISMENHDGTSIYGNTTSAPYINGTLIAKYASTSNFTDPLPLSVPSEPHYVWMEAGTNVFADITFASDDDPSATNSTASTEHLSTQIDAKGGLSWRAYQEGIDSTSGACPIHASGFYQPKHDPFIFFQDVSGNPPSDTNTYCADHHRLLSALSGDLTQNQVARYNFITPDQCHDMHGQFGCPSIDLVKPADDWLAANVPALISFCEANDGVIFVVWDEGESTPTIPFVAVGPGVKNGYSGSVKYTHGSLVKTVEEIFGLPILSTVASENDFADLLKPGALP